MSHISYWMNAVNACSAQSFIAHHNLPLIESIRFIPSADTFSKNTLYLGCVKDLAAALDSADDKTDLNEITFFISNTAEVSINDLRSNAHLRQFNLVCGKTDLLTMYDSLNSLMLQYRSWEKAFEIVSGHGHSIQDIVDTAAKLCNSNIFLLNTAGKLIVCHVNSDIPDSVSRELAETGFLSPELTATLISSGCESRIVRKELADGCSCWIYKVTKHGTAISHMLFIRKEPDRNFDIYTIMELTRNSIHKLMTESGGPAYWAGERFKSILEDIVEGRLTDNYEINRRFSMISCSTGMFCTFIIIGFHIPKTLDQNATQFLTELEELFPDNHAAIYDGCVVIMLSKPTRIFQPKPIFDSSAFTRLLKNYDAYASISNATSHRSLLRTQYIMTKQVLILGRKLFPDSKERYYFFEDFAEYLTIDFSISNFRHMFGHDDIVLLIHPDAMKLVKYDRDHGTNLLEFVYYYCLCNCNINHTAKRAYMHRNTASSRLAKVNELITADLENGEVQQRMIFSYKVYRYYSRCSDFNLETRMEKDVLQR